MRCLWKELELRLIGGECDYEVLMEFDMNQ